MEKKQIIIASILGIAFVLGLSFAAYQVSRIRKVPSEISVTGIAERNFKSDLIVWTATYSVQDYSSSEGYQDLQWIGKRCGILSRRMISQSLPTCLVGFRSPKCMTK